MILDLSIIGGFKMPNELTDLLDIAINKESTSQTLYIAAQSKTEDLGVIVAVFHHRHSKLKPHGYRPKPLGQHYLYTCAHGRTIVAGVDYAAIDEKQCCNFITHQRNRQLTACQKYQSLPIGSLSGPALVLTPRYSKPLMLRLPPA